MYPVINITNNIKIPMYSSVFMIGFFLAMLIAFKEREKYKLGKDDLIFGTAYAGIGLLIGAKVLFFLTKLPKIMIYASEYIDYLETYPMYAINYAFGGLVFYGGLIGAIVGVRIYCKMYNVSIIPYMEIYAPLIPFIHAFGRIGCFLSGCCYGKEYYGIFKVVYPENEMIPELNDVPRIPVQLIEAICNFAFSFILYKIMKKNKLKDGQGLGVYLIYYAILRFLTEFMRGDKIRGNIGILSTSQIISLIILPVGVALVNKRTRKTSSLYHEVVLNTEETLVEKRE